MIRKPTLIILTGPTAVGKTDLAIRLANHFKTDIVSCDSRQLYKETTIGTAKPTSEDLLKVKHHFIDHLSITNSYTTADYASECEDLLAKLFVSNDFVVMTGGTGLYIKAVIEGLDSFPEVPENIKDEYENLFKLEGLQPLQSELASLDPEYYNKVDQQNSRRLIRALSVIKISGKKYSSFLSSDKKINNFDHKYFVLNRPRQELYKRINERVDIMMQNGLLEEAKSVLPFRNNPSLNTVGYKELFDFFDETCSLEFAVDKIKQHSRNYAKRQLTWFKKVNEAIWLENNDSTFQEIIKILND